MAKSFFVTGTDTEVGKTLITSALLHAYKKQGLTTAAIKPVAAGCINVDGQWQNDDALQLIDAMTVEMPYEQVNPVALEAPIAPHIAAREEGRNLNVDRLAGLCQGVFLKRMDVTLIEGAGGWRVPLNHRETLADLAIQLNVPVILVVGIRLGCLNHAFLTAEAIRRDGLNLAGWVANIIDADCSRKEENIQTLKTGLSSPCLGVIPYQKSPRAEDVAGYLDLEAL